MRKGPAAEAERDAPQRAVGGIARDTYFFFFSSFIFFILCLDQWTQHDQTNIFFLPGNAPGGAFCPTCVLKNAPGALFRNCFMERLRGRLLRYLRYMVKVIRILKGEGVGNGVWSKPMRHRGTKHKVPPEHKGDTSIHTSNNSYGHHTCTVPKTFSETC